MRCRESMKNGFTYVAWKNGNPYPTLSWTWTGSRVRSSVVCSCGRISVSAAILDRQYSAWPPRRICTIRSTLWWLYSVWPQLIHAAAAARGRNASTAVAFQRPDGAQFEIRLRLCGTSSRYLSAAISTSPRDHWTIRHLMRWNQWALRPQSLRPDRVAELSVCGKMAGIWVSFWRACRKTKAHLMREGGEYCDLTRTHLSLNRSVLFMPLNVKQIPSSVKTSINKSEQLYGMYCHLHCSITSSNRSATCHRRKLI